MSSPPPGYNPEASQLHGGTDAPIAKVMGGGGVPDGYNESQSLLQGGTDVPIVKMTGGAESDFDFLEGLEELPKNITPLASESLKAQVNPRVTFANAHGPGNIQGPTKTENGAKPPIEKSKPIVEKPLATVIQAEVYEPRFSEEDSIEIRKFVTTFSINMIGVKPRLIELIELFKIRSKNKLVRYDKNSRAQSAAVPTVAAPQTLAHKIVELLPSTTSNIIIVPPVKGNYEMFIRSVEFLYANDMIDANDKLVEHTVLIFMAPFFSKDGDQRRLLYSFLTLQEKNRDAVFAIQNDDGNARDIGTALYTDLNPGDGLFLNYLNPSYIIFPKKIGTHDGLLFSSAAGNDSTFPKITNKGFLPVSTLLDKRAFSINATGAQTDQTFANYLTILSQNDTTPLPITRGDVQMCGTLKTVFNLTDAGPFQISTGEDIYVLRFGTTKRPLMCAALMDDSDKFLASDSDPAFYDVPTIDVYVSGRKWKFRDPMRNKFTKSLDEIASGEAAPETRNPVVLNWERGIYSTSEAAFLNHLNLSPLLLGMIFNSDIWKTKLAKFMNNLVTSNCFEDTDILMKGSCEDTRNFLNTVFNFLFMKDSVKDDELDIPPLKLPPLPHSQDGAKINWPSELEDIDPDEFKKDYLDSTDLRANIRTDTYFMDLIVIHKKSLERSTKRLRLDRVKTDADPEENDVIFAEVLEDLKEDHPDFLFIY